ncbi:diguanylate cyclase [Scytonema hofmannii FACHB-248]|uniref:Diguanylate cyclase n=1 Tax=Scytonema hofmannii FACHB-248 TaxID=1842502 RepID=A0ABR8GQM8_9CYAN|nr:MULTISPECIES: diguanylate cyclase [Nostocales]MBD2605504.1 diguanylate cyclase [Scytonema hofmannii FACHB-248]
MNISILVFGSDKFLANLPDQIRDATVFSVEVIANLNQAVSRIQITPPDIMLVQASLNASTELCCWLKDQTKLSSIYCILFEDRLELISQRNWEWDLEKTSTALKQGADAYIWQIPEEKRDRNSALSANNRLILAQLTVGLRKAQKYRDMIKKNDVLSAIALADSLTQMNNRRALDLDLPRQIQKARNHNNPLSLIILDVDFFKKVNDTYGHLVGDRILQLLSARLRNNLRFEDTPFRYGGEEFVIILPNTTGEDALLVARRLNRIVNQEPFTIDNQVTINVTISLGTASLQDEDDEDGISMLNRADKYLLQAKATGRNRAISSNYLSHIPHLQVVSS